MFAILAGLIFVCIGFAFGLYKLFKPVHRYYIKFLKSRFYTLMVCSFLAYFGYEYIFQSGIPRLVILWGSLFSLWIITLFDLIYDKVVEYYEQNNPYQMLVFYQEKKDFQEFQKNFEDYENYDIQGVGLNNLEFDDDHKKYIDKNSIVVLLGSYSRNFLQKVLDYSRLNGKKFYHIFESFFLEDLVYNPDRLGPVIGFEYKPSPLDGRYRVIKRLFDILFSILFLIFFWWIYPLIAIFIILKDWRPFIYESERVGKNGEKFQMYKFRSMVENAEEKKEKLMDKNERQGPLFKMEDDPRIPKWWEILRKTSLDELPQVWNILKGEMSWIGPRPHLEKEVKKYEKWQKRLLSIKPGLTGYAQIFGRDELEFEKEAKLDLHYIQNWNLLLDIYIIFTTVKVVFSGK